METMQNGQATEEAAAARDGSVCGYKSLHRLLRHDLNPQVFQEVSRLHIGLNCVRTLQVDPLADSAKALSSECNFDIQAFRFTADKEELREPRVVKVGLIQNSIVLPTTTSFLDHNRMKDAAGALGVNILCLHEVWMMPFAFCTREKRRRENMFIVNPIVERDRCHCQQFIDRVGTESFSNLFTSGDGKPQQADFGHFYGSSHFSAPDPLCTRPHRDGSVV
ncbi:beta-ureidopropionase-like [Rhodamnia argentea]|uniref:Beta-ureidopropionase-like n=1 Tax=Rhodamnia argentea TaxID=178133 RepID=A0A8B8N4B7_9MYRT|nr:beta-ureidopropionase-like [Rhodamnia argentea]